MPSAVARLAAALVLVPVLACRPKGTVTTHADGSTTVASGGNVVSTDPNGNVSVRSADGSSVEVPGAAVRGVGAQAGPAAPLGVSAVLVDRDGTTHAAGAAVDVSEDDLRQTIDCGSGGSVSVSGSDNVLALVGRCARVSVTGSDNTLTVAAAGAIDLAGSDNQVTYAAGLGGREPAVTNAGEDNTVARGGR